MLMKIVTAVLTVLLILTLAAGALFYLKAYKPMVEDNARMTGRIPELDKAKRELGQSKEKESKETAWLKPAIDALSAGLGNEIKSGKAEVLIAGNRVVVNIAEQELYLPDSYTFAKESPQIRANLLALLKGDAVKGKDIYIGNTTHAVPAQGRGRKKIASKDARTLAAERSAVLIKYLEKNGVSQDALIAAAYSPQQPKMGSLIKDRKTVIIIESPPTVPVGATNAAAAQNPAKQLPDSREP
jgi:outer membrane protein OmpA-like peptidoglycan-associated protein